MMTNILRPNWLSDTVADTVKIAVSVNTHYYIRKYESSPSVGSVYLDVFAGKNRERLNIAVEFSAMTAVSVLYSAELF